MDHESWLLRQRDDFAHGLLKRAKRVGIGWLVEADMAVADLQECQALGFLRLRLAHDAQRVRHAAGDGPQHAGADPGHAFENFASVDAIVAVEIAHCHSPMKRTGPRPLRLLGLLRTRLIGGAAYSRCRELFGLAPTGPEDEQGKGRAEARPSFLWLSIAGAFDCSRRCHRRWKPGRWNPNSTRRPERWRRHAARSDARRFWHGCSAERCIRRSEQGSVRN